MNCEIIVNISRFNLKIFYSQNKNSYKSFKYEKSESIPFYVFSDDNDFEVGDSAKIKFKNHFPNSYSNYFDLIKDTKSTFPFLDGEEKKISYLLIYSIEIIIKELFKTLLISDNLSKIRDSIKLNLVFSSDISDVEINFLLNTFKDFGYNNCKCLNSSYLILNYLNIKRKIGAFKDNSSKMGSFKGYVVVDAIDNNLYIDFFDSLNKKFPKLHEEGIDLASNPKVKILAKEMFTQTADYTGSQTTEEVEVPHLIPLAQKWATSSKSEFRVKVTLTDGQQKNVKIKMSAIDEKLSWLSEFTKDFDLVKSLVKKSKLENMDLAFIIKNSVDSQGFIDKFKSTYNNIYHLNNEFIDICDLFISNEDVINQGDFGSKITKPIVIKPISTLESKPSVSSPTPAPQPTLPPSVRPISKPQIKSGSVPKKSPPSTPPPPSVRPIPKPQINSGSVKKSPPPPPSKPPMVSKAIAIKTKVKTPPPPPPPPRAIKNAPKDIRDVKNSPNKPLQPRRPNVAAKPPMASKPATKKNKGRVPPPPPPPPLPKA